MNWSEKKREESRRKERREDEEGQEGGRQGRATALLEEKEWIYSGPVSFLALYSFVTLTLMAQRIPAAQGVSGL